MRGALVGFILFVFAMYLADNSNLVGAGGQFASMVVLCGYGFLTLVGGLYFSICIVEEIEEQTLPLLKMTGATPLTVLLGKSIPRLALAVLFILVMVPFFVLSVTLGGVLIWGLISAVLGLLTYTVMLSQLGTFASLICRTSRRAFVLTGVLWFALEFPITWTWLIEDLTSGWLDASGWFGQRSLLFNANYYVSSWGADDLWRPQMTFHLLLAAGFLTISRLLFERMTAAAVAGDDGPASLTTKVQQRARSAARVPSIPLAWKVWAYTTGGTTWALIRCFGLTIAVVLLAFAVGEAGSLHILGEVLFAIGIPFCLVNVAFLFGRVFNSEIRDGTLSGLLMLPISRASLVTRMLTGTIPAAISAGGCIAIGILLQYADDSYRFVITTNDVADLSTEPAFLQLFSWLAATYMLGLVLSVRMRHGGMLLAILLGVFIAPFVVLICLETARFSGSGVVDDSEFFLVLGVCECGFCVLMSRQLIADIDRYGAAS